MKTIMVLPSVSGEEFDLFLSYPEGWTEYHAITEAGEALRAYNTLWDIWDKSHDIEDEEPTLSESLDKYGFTMLDHITGPCWDD